MVNQQIIIPDWGGHNLQTVTVSKWILDFWCSKSIGITCISIYLPYMNSFLNYYGQDSVEINKHGGEKWNRGRHVKTTQIFQPALKFHPLGGKIPFLLFLCQRDSDLADGMNLESVIVINFNKPTDYWK